MCHLSIEKALKGLYAQRLLKDPPKIHDLNYFCEKINLLLPEGFQDFLDILNDLSILARYPDRIEKLMREYKKDKTREILDQTKKLLQWLKKKF